MVNRKKSKIVSKERKIPKWKAIKFRRKAKLRSVVQAERTVSQLELDFENAHNRSQERKIKRSLILGANRAEKKAVKRRISKAKKQEYLDVADVYKSAYQRMVISEIWDEIERPAIPE